MTFPFLDKNWHSQKLNQLTTQLQVSFWAVKNKKKSFSKPPDHDEPDAIINQNKILSNQINIIIPFLFIMFKNDLWLYFLKKSSLVLIYLLLKSALFDRVVCFKKLIFIVKKMRSWFPMPPCHFSGMQRGQKRPWGI